MKRFFAIITTMAMCISTSTVIAETTPEPVTSPEVTEIPTETPEVSTSPEITPTPGDFSTPDATVTPDVTATPEITTSPEVTTTPSPTPTDDVSSRITELQKKIKDLKMFYDDIAINPISINTDGTLIDETQRNTFNEEFDLIMAMVDEIATIDNTVYDQMENNPDFVFLMTIYQSTNSMQVAALLLTAPSVDTLSKIVYGNGNPLVIVSNGSGGTDVYWDKNGNGLVDDSVAALASGDLSGYDIYGGGNLNLITGDTLVTMTGGTVNNIYGGGNIASVSGNLIINISGGTVLSGVFGGGKGALATGTNATINISGSANLNTVYGGGASSSLSNSETINMTGGTVQWIYGGNYTGITTARININISGGTVVNTVTANGNLSLGTGTKILRISGNPVIGDKTSKGIDLASLSDSRFMVNKALTGNMADITIINTITISDTVIATASDGVTIDPSKFITTNKYGLSVKEKDLIIKRAQVTIGLSSSSSNITEKNNFSLSAILNIDWKGTLVPAANYSLPSTITITVGGITLPSTSYSYNSTTGSLTIFGGAITGNILITAVGVSTTYSVVYNANNGTGSIPATQSYQKSSTVNVAFTPLPTLNFYSFTGWSLVNKGINGTPDYTQSGANSFTISNNVTLYATWQSGTVKLLNQSVNGINATAKFEVNFVGAPSGVSQYGITINGTYYAMDANSLVDSGNGRGSYTVTVTTLTASDTFTVNANINNQLLTDYATTVTMPAYDPSNIQFNGLNYTLSPVFAGLSISYDNGNTWTSMTSQNVINGTFQIPLNFTGSSVWIYRPGNGVIPDSTIRKINLSKASVPTVTVNQPTTVSGKGSIKNINANVMYSLDAGVTWLGSVTELENLAQGTTVLLRTNGGANMLCSDPITVSINTVLAMDAQTYTITPYTGTYDGQTHNAINITSTIPGAVIQYGTSPSNLSPTIPQIKDVGTVKVYYSISAAGYETIQSSVAVNATVSAKELTATYQGETIVYGGLPTLQVNVTGFVNGENATTDNTYINPIVINTNTNAGVYTLTPSGGNPGKNYVFAYTSGSLTIQKGSLHVNIQGYSGIYDGLAHGPIINNNDAEQIRYTVNNFDMGTTVPVFKNVGTYTVQYVASRNNYVDKTGEFQVVITPKDISVTVQSINSKTYDGTTSSSGVLNIEGIIGNDNVSANGTFEFTDKNSENNKIVNITNIRLSGSDVANYNCLTTSLTGNANIKPIVVGITWTNTNTRSYDGIASNVSASISNAISGESPALTISGNAATNTGIHTAMITGVNDSNYTLTGASNLSQRYTISPREITIAWSNNSTKVYDGISSNVTATITNLVDSDECNLLISNNTQTNAGIHTATITGLAGNKSDNYKLPTIGLTTTYTITKASLTASFDSKTITYGTTPNLELNVSGFVNNETILNASNYVSPTVTISPNFDNQSMPSVGIYNITPVGGSADNYSFIHISGSLTINKADLTIHSTGFNGTYDAKSHGVSVTSDQEGATILYGETAGNYTLNQSPQYTNVGSYTVYYKVSKPNYNDYIGSETVVINKKTVTPIILSVNDKVYDGTTTANGVLKLSGVEDVDASSVTATGTFTFSNKDAGQNKKVNVANIAFNTPNSNYQLSVAQLNDIETTATITKAVLTATYNATIEYNATPPTTVIVSGFVHNENAENATDYNAPTVTINQTNHGTYTITPTGGSALNYSFNNIPGTLTILPENVSVTVNNYVGVYDGEYHSGSVIVTSIDDEYEYTYSETQDGIYTSTVPKYKNVGNHQIWYKISDIKDFDEEDLTGSITVTITKRVVSATINHVDDKVYDKQTNTTGTLKFDDSVAQGDDLTAIGQFAFTDKNVGDDKAVLVTNIQLTSDSQNNYELDDTFINETSTTAKIKPKPITLTWSGLNPRIYDGKSSNVSAIANGLYEGDTITINVSNGNNINVLRNPDSKVVTNYTATATLSGNDNYIIESNHETEDYTIIPAELQAKYSGENIVYGQTPQLAINVTGFVNNEDAAIQGYVAPVASVTSTLNDLNKPNVGRYEVVGKNGSANNYDFIYTSGVLVVNPIDIDLQINGYEGIYDGEKHELDIVKKDSDVTIEYRLSESDPWVSDEFEFADVGTYEISYVAKQPNHNDKMGIATIKILPKEIEATADSINSKVYDGAVNTTGTLKLIGVLSKDEADIRVEGAIEFVDKNVSTNKNVNLKNLVLSGNQSSNYVLEETNKNDVATTASITPLEVSLVWSNYTSRIYDQSSSNVMASIDNQIANDDIEVVVTNGNRIHAGTYKAIAVDLDGDDSNNYVLPSNPNQEYTIVPKELTLSWENTENLIYNGLEKNVVADVTGVITNDTVNVTTKDGNQVHAGIYSASASIDNQDYKLPTANTKTYTIGKAPLQAKYDGETITYGNNPTFHITVTGFVNGEEPGSNDEDKRPLDYLQPVIINNNTNVGTYVLTPQDGSAADYEFTYQSGNLVIQNATLSVLITGYNDVYTGENHGLNTQIPSDALIMYGTTDGTYDLVDSPTLKNAGSITVYYKVTKNNYEDLMGSAVITVGRKTVNPTVFTVDDKTYDGSTTTKGSISLTGVVSVDEVKASGVINFADKNAGENKTVHVNNIQLNGVDKDNYTLSTTELLNQVSTAQIHKKEISLLWNNNESLSYDGTEHQFTPTSIDFVESNDAYLEVLGDKGTHSGSYNVIVNDIKGNDKDNYDLPASTVKNYTIAKAVLNANYINETVVFNGTPKFEVSVSGFVNNETPSTINGYVKPTVSINDWNAGMTYQLTPSGGNPGNDYSFAYGTGVLTVTYANMNDAVEGKDVEVKYDGNSHTIDILAPEDSTITRAYYTEPGTYSINWKVEKEDYEPVIGTNTLTILANTPTPTVIPTTEPTSTPTPNPTLAPTKKPTVTPSGSTATPTTTPNASNKTRMGSIQGGAFYFNDPNQVIEVKDDLKIELDQGEIMLLMNRGNLKNTSIDNGEDLINDLFSQEQLNKIAKGSKAEVMIEIEAKDYQEVEMMQNFNNQLQEEDMEICNVLEVEFNVRLDDEEWQSVTSFNDQYSINLQIDISKILPSYEEFRIWKINDSSLIELTQFKQTDDIIELKINEPMTILFTCDTNLIVKEEKSTIDYSWILIPIGIIIIGGVIVLIAKRRKSN
ncbi:beta strand repeat-containing protein [Anaerorhabdus furcosa]|uniref:Uncharacterized protein n=1 Tax=Anaerorhabdus furcosa TaxID=118967 RepID=A0A1T4JZ81_9FIRM|nr:YDG domain-containing protein [Anaerorhabdus furcosa]SJZ35434.1 hypothetical protein SAMN02745191_0184 [Anaerorhabdus furcosa]